jgi:plastocyanin
LVLACIGFYIYNSKQTQAPTVEDSQSQSPNIVQESSDKKQAATGTASSTLQTTTEAPKSSTEEAGQFSGEPEPITGNVDISVHEVTYDGENFSPKTLTIKVGDYVYFKNASDKSFRPASNPHPAHIDYAEFDAKTGIAAGQTFSFQFLRLGTWNYHDHLNPSAIAKVLVEK